MYVSAIYKHTHHKMNNALRPQLPRETSKRRGIRIKITMNYSFRRFALGIEISKHYATLDFGFFWIAFHY